MEISSRNEGETKTFSDGKAKKQKEPKRICCQHTYSRRMAKGNSLNGKKKKMIKEKYLGTSGMKKEHRKQKYG